MCQLYPIHHEPHRTTQQYQQDGADFLFQTEQKNDGENGKAEVKLEGGLG